MHHSSIGKNKDYRITVTEEAPGTYRVYTEHGPVIKFQIILLKNLFFLHFHKKLFNLFCF